MTTSTALIVRWSTLAMLVLVCGPSLVAAVRARGTAMTPPLLAIAALTGSAVYSQISLLGTPATTRTWVNLAAAAAAIALLVWGALRGPDPTPPAPALAIDPLSGLTPELRDVIHRHPELLAAFAERWRLAHPPTED